MRERRQDRRGAGEGVYIHRFGSVRVGSVIKIKIKLSSLQINIFLGLLISLSRILPPQPQTTPSKKAPGGGVAGIAKVMPLDQQTAPPWWWCLWGFRFLPEPNWQNWGGNCQGKNGKRCESSKEHQNVSFKFSGYLRQRPFIKVGINISCVECKIST